jgi:hypothetical protein
MRQLRKKGAQISLDALLPLILKDFNDVRNLNHSQIPGISVQ